MAELEAYEKNMHTGMKWKVTTNLANTTVKNTPCSSNGTVVLASAGSEGGESGMIDNPYYDEILDGKSAYLNDAFFVTRTIIYLVLWVFIGYQLRRFSIKEERNRRKCGFKRLVPGLQFSWLYGQFPVL